MRLPIENEKSQDQNHLEKQLIIQGGEREEGKGMQGEGRDPAKRQEEKKERVGTLNSYKSLKFQGGGISQYQMQH